jgi:putative ABC transport system permease protein
MPAILKDQIDLNIPEVESSVRLASTWEQPVFQVEGREPVTSDMVTVDDGFFKLFTYEVVEGNLETALKEPMSIVLMQPLAEKLFGKESAVGKTLKINNDKSLFVSAVIREPQSNSCLSFNSVTSIETRKIVNPNDREYFEWGWRNFQLFVLLKKGAKPTETASKIASLFPKNPKDRQDYSILKLNPINKVYLSKFSLYGSTYLRCGDKKKIMILMLVAALVLIIALVNFINISSSQWHEKIKQTGVQKITGANKAIIFKNVIAETCLLFLISLFLSIFLIELTIPYISNYTGIHFNPSILSRPAFLIIAITATCILSLMFSIVPALRISSSKAVDNLKKTIHTGFSTSISRGIMVTTQFTITIVLIAFTLLVQKQVRFGSSNLGFNQENIVGIKLTSQLNDKKDVLGNLLKEKANVSQIAFTQYYPGKPMSHWSRNQVSEGEKKLFDFDIFNADAAFFKITGLELAKGNFYSDELETDRNKVIVNETFVSKHNLENPIGTKLYFGASKDDGFSEIVGVVKDFHYKSMNQPIDALIIQNEQQDSYCWVKFQSIDFGSLLTTIQEIKDEAAKLSPSFPIELTFLDQAVEGMYQSELQFRRTFSLFAVCAIVISCLGILAMSLSACQRRTKEIGIRKVNGARVSEILIILNTDFVKWVVIAFIFATPVAWFAMNKWLQYFVYKTSVSWWIFALAGFMAIGIALLTISLQSWKTATRNPVEALRYE